MKTRIAAAVASLLIASAGTAAYAAQTTPQTTPPSSSMQSDQSMSNGNMNNNMMSKDQKIEQKVKHELMSHGVTATNVQVSFSDGTATLTGTVDTHADIAKAKKDAMRVRGVKHVDVSGLQVQQAPGSSD
ncbi:MAG: BON domain-containing protein [Rhodanobacteraceae bacterium]